MASQRSENTVKQSLLVFIVFTLLSIVFFFGAAIYLNAHFNIDTCIRAFCIQVLLSFATYLSWKSHWINRSEKESNYSDTFTIN